THPWTYNDIASLRGLFEKLPEQIAAVIMEPVGVEEPVPGFLESVRALAHSHGALLLFDEVITGFRFAPGGAQELFGVVPDLAAFGKGLANGYPLAAVVGRSEIMRLITSTAFISGTFAGDAVALAAAKATLEKVTREDVCRQLWQQGAAVRDGFNALATAHGVPASMVGLAPRRVLELRPESGLDALTLKGLIWQECLDRGVLLGNANFISLAHDGAAVDQTLTAFEGALSAVGRALSSGTVGTLLRGEPPCEVVRRP
ncbi:MAG: aminotransferase class III-fold pyridoxal phosphate-dependent enzyme, partial [Candidatus Dormiibacterota bacterium]